MPAVIRTVPRVQIDLRQQTEALSRGKPTDLQRKRYKPKRSHKPRNDEKPISNL